MKKGLISTITHAVRERKKNDARGPAQNANGKLFQVSSIFEYISCMINSKISPAEKRRIGIEFLRSTGITAKELERERNLHPYYKALKNRNQNKRQNKRNSINRKKKSEKWTESELKEFVRLNDSCSDMDLAMHFNRSVPGINAIRRRINVIKSAGMTHEIEKLIMRDERTLKKILK